MKTDIWELYKAQSKIQPFLRKVAYALVQAGYNEYDRDAASDAPGFAIGAITPSMGGWHRVEIQHIDHPGADLRPAIARYSGILEAAGIEHRIELRPFGEYIEGWPVIEVPYKLVPVALEVKP